MIKKITLFLGCCLAMVCSSSLLGQAGAYSFAASTGTFTPITGGTDVNSIEADYAISSSIPIGFTFEFEGTSYTSLKASSDGWLSFNSSAGATGSNDLDNTAGSRRPLVAALWDDLDGRSSNSASKASYAVTGTSPNRVFTFEWKNWEWNYGAGDSVVSFQVKLFETTNEIQFAYRWENYAGINNPSASIGLSGVSSFLSVSGIDAGTPVVSNSLETSSIDTIVTDQIFTFTPPACVAPNFTNATGITANSATVNWTVGSGSYEVNWDVTGFTQGAATSNTSTVSTNSFTASSLMAGTAYDFYIRQDCGGGVYSAWVGPYTITTVYSIPYLENWTGGYPHDWTEGVGHISDSTIFTSNSSSWTSDNFTNAGSTSARVNIYGTTRKEWLMSPSIDLGTGNSYELTFDAGLTKYGNGNSATLGVDDTVKVVISTDNGVTWSDTNTIFTLTSSDVINNGNGNHYIVSLAGYSGIVKIGFYAQSTVSNEDNNFFVDNVVVHVPPACQAPTALTDSNITINSLDLGWQSSGSGPWYVYWGPCGFDQATPSIHLDTTAVKSITLSSLASNSSYEFYVFEDCGTNGLSDSIHLGCISTLCGALNTPITEGFNSVSNTQNCWTVLDANGDGDAWDLDYTSNPYEGDEAAMIYTDYNSGNNDDWLISPGLILSNNQRLKFQYRVQSSGEPNDFEVLVSTTGTNPADFTDTIVPFASYSNINYQQMTVDLSAFSGTTYLAWHVPAGGLDGWRLYIDEVIVEDIPPCPMSTGFVSNYATTDSIGLSWTPGGNATTYGVEYGPSGFTPGNGTTASTTDTFYVAKGLTAQTSYDFYLTDTCSGGYSTTLGPITVMTLCNPVSAPYTEGFEDASVHRSCWDNIHISATKDWTYGTGSSGGAIASAYAGSKNAVFTSSSSGAVTRLVSPYIDVTALNNPYLKFYYGQEDWSGDQNKLKVYVRDVSSSTWILVYGDSSNVSAWTLGEALLPVSTDTIQLAFEGHDEYGRANVLDEVQVVEGPACPPVTALSVSNVSDTAATLGWGASYTSLTYQVWYGPKGFYQGTTTIGGNKVFTTSNSYIVDTLSPTSCYEFLVRNICSGGDSTMWVGPFGFSTNGGNITLPVFEDFENGLTYFKNPCNNITDWMTQQSIVKNGSSAGKLTYQNNDNSSLVMASMLDLSATTNPTLAFWQIAALEGGYDKGFVEISTNGGKSYAALPDSAYIGTANSYRSDLLFDEDDYSTWGTSTAPAQNSWWKHEIFDLSAYKEDSVMIRFRLTSDGSGIRDGWYLDDISIADVSCPAPMSQGVIASSITATSANIYWTTGGSSDYNIEYGYTGFTQGTGTMLNATNDTTLLTGLTPDSCYDFYVRDSCGVGDVSTWVGPFNFCLPPTCPAPSNLGVDASSITLTSADVYWTSGGASNFNIEYGTAGFTQGMGTHVQSPNDTLTLTSLSSGTKYEFYVRDSCSATDTSTWAGPFSFITAFNTNYLQDFTQASPFAWSEARGRLTANTTFTASTSSWGQDNFGNTGSASQRVNLFTSNQFEWLLSPSIYVDPNISNLQVEFDVSISQYNSSSQGYLDGSDDTLALIVSTDNGQTWSSTNVLWYTDENDTVDVNGEHVIIPLSGYSGYVKFGFYGGSFIDDTHDNDFYIDNFEVRTPRACNPPSGLTISNVRTDSALVSWTAGTPGFINAEVFYTLGNQSASSGTVVNSTNDSVYLTGLAHSTNYCVYVVEQCTNGYSDTLGPVCFNTLCLKQSLPYTEDFSSSLGCFTTVDSSSDASTWMWEANHGTSDNVDGSPGFMIVDSDGAGQVDMDEYAYTPEIDASGLSITDSLFIQFDQYWRVYTLGGSEVGDVDVYDGSSWVNVFSQNQSTGNVGAWGSPDMVKINITAYANANLKVRLHYYDANYDYYWAIDNFSVFTENFACPAPTNVAVSNISCDSVQVSWVSNATTTSSYLEYGAKGFTPGSGMLISNVNSPYYINGLPLNTEYDVYVMDSCSTDGSVATGPITFKTDSLGPLMAAFSQIQSDTTLVDATVDFDGSASTGDGLTYSWDFGNGSNGTGSTATATYTGNGSYTVTLTVTDRCGNTADSTVTITVGGISIVENAYKVGIDVYPNPSQGDFKVKVSGGSADYSVEVLDLSGKIVYRKENLEPGMDHEINLGKVAPGVYLVRFSGKGLSATQRIMID